MKELKTACGKSIKIDDEDFTRLSRYRWYIAGRGYARASKLKCLDGQFRSFYLHRLLCLPGESFSFAKVVHHIDGDALNNQKANLKICHQSENCRGFRKDKQQELRGISRPTKKNPKWRAVIHLGSFDTPEEAARAWDAANSKIFGDVGQLNFKKYE